MAAAPALAEAPEPCSLDVIKGSNVKNDPSFAAICRRCRWTGDARYHKGEADFDLIAHVVGRLLAEGAP
jgi:hypothetical protein